MKFISCVLRYVYSVAVFLLLPFLMFYLLFRAKKQPEYLLGWSQRFLAQVPIGHKALSSTRRIWVHAVSVGETRAIAPLVMQWAQAHPDDVWVFSSITPTGQATARQLFGSLKGAQFFYLPYDLPFLASRCLQRLNANMLWLVETELWPNLIMKTRQAGIKTALINARVSPNTAKWWKRLRLLVKPTLQKVDCIACQTIEDAEKFQAIGRPVDAIIGNLKFDIRAQPELQQEGRFWRSKQGRGPVLVFASSREKEEDMLLQAMVRNQFFKRLPRATVIVVPRHPQRFDEVFSAMQLASAQLGVAMPVRRSHYERYEDIPLSNLVLGDSMGEMPIYYSVANVAFLGGSWEPLGGQNLIEACAYGCPVWLGPYVWNFAKAAEDALHAGAAMRFEDLNQAVESFLERDGEMRPTMQEAAEQFSKAHSGAVDKVMALLNY